jgi:hypothetical protein
MGPVGRALRPGFDPGYHAVNLDPGPGIAPSETGGPTRAPEPEPGARPTPVSWRIGPERPARFAIDPIDPARYSARSPAIRGSATASYPKTIDTVRERGVAERALPDRHRETPLSYLCTRSTPGEVAERLNAPVSKTGMPVRVSGVRIPPSPLHIPRNLLICGQLPRVRGAPQRRLVCRSRPVKTAPGGVRLPHDFPTVRF